MSPEGELHPPFHPRFPDRSRSGEVLRNLSVDIIPIIHDPEYPTLQRFLNKVIDKTAEQYQAVMRDEISMDEVVKDVVFFVGTPGSGKSHSMKIFDDAVRARRIPDTFVHKVAWEDADIKHLEDKKKRYKARPLSSPEEMFEANQRMISQFHTKKNWLLASGEYAPIVIKNHSGNWEGRDGGATCIEHILQTTPNIRPHVVGTAAEWRLDELKNAAREVGAYGNQVWLYQQYAISFAQHLLREGKLQAPDYLQDYLLYTTDSTPLMHEDFPPDMRKLIRPNSKLHLSTPHMQERFSYLDQHYGRKEAKQIATWESENRIAQADCTSITTLYLMNHMFTQELQVPEKDIFMGIMAPPIERFTDTDSPTMTSYMQNYSLADLLETDE